MIFTSEKLGKPDELVNAVKNTTINYVEYELNTATASDTQVDLESDPDTVAHTSNIIIDQQLLNFQTTG